MNKKVYLDTCCYNRPFDDLSKEKIRSEAKAKMYIQTLIKYKSLELYSSFMLSYEVNKNPFEKNKELILHFINEYSSIHVSEKRKDEVIEISKEIMKSGIKYKDAVHLACSLIAKCDYFITTDKRVLKYKTEQTKILNPIKFVEIWREIK